MDRFDRGGLSMCRIPPDWRTLIHCLVGMILNRVDLGVLDVGPVSSDSLVISFVSWLAMLEGPVLRWQPLEGCFLHQSLK